MTKGLQVDFIDAAETYPWLLQKHYAKRLPQITDSFGLFDGQDLIGVCTFGKPASPWLCKGVCGDDYSEIVYELNRLCLKDNVKNHASFFVSKSLRLISKPRIIVSYADRGMGHVGKVYQAANFLYTGATAERTDVDTGDKHARHIDGLDYSKRKVRTSKHRYVIFIGSKGLRKKAREALNYPVLPYPKGDPLRYDADVEIVSQMRLF